MFDELEVIHIIPKEAKPEPKPEAPKPSPKPIELPGKTAIEASQQKMKLRNGAIAIDHRGEWKCRKCRGQGGFKMTNIKKLSDLYVAFEAECCLCHQKNGNRSEPVLDFFKGRIELINMP